VTRLANEVAADIADARKLDPEAFSRLILMESRGELTTTQARAVLKDLLEHGGDPAAIAAGMGFEAMAAGEVTTVVDEIIAANPPEWERFAAGEDKLQGFFIGKVKAATGGKADPAAVATLLRQRRGT
jgi:Asp-tRNA(Asn)/Glu-tRNA(Gln) amidotransferase B subunit